METVLLVLLSLFWLGVSFYLVGILVTFTIGMCAIADMAGSIGKKFVFVLSWALIWPLVLLKAVE